jgi:hypothetical protein
MRDKHILIKYFCLLKNRYILSKNNIILIKLKSSPNQQNDIKKIQIIIILFYILDKNLNINLVYLTFVKTPFCFYIFYKIKYKNKR